MSDLAVASIVFACVFGGALLGMLLRVALPEHHLDDRSKDVVRLGMGLVATMAQEARDVLRQIVTVALERLWPEDAAQTATLAAPGSVARGRSLYGKIQGLSPQNDMQRRLQSDALRITTELGQARWLLAAQGESGSVPMPFLVILLFWLAVLFVSFGLFAPPNATVIATLFLCALSVSGAIFLILELAKPFEGLLQISSAPLRKAVALLGQ
jgi:hypothetical protein